MTIDHELKERQARRERGLRLAWIAAGVAVLSTLILLGPAPEFRLGADAHTGALQMLDHSAPAAAPEIGAMTERIHWDAKEAAADPGPLAIAAYER